MRTRIYNKLNVKEIQNYLDEGGDTIFLPAALSNATAPILLTVRPFSPNLKLLSERLRTVESRWTEVYQEDILPVFPIM